MAMSQVNKLSDLTSLYESHFNRPPVSLEKLPGGGGDRVYYRLRGSDGATVIGVVCDTPRDASAFVALAKVFGHEGIHVPYIICESADRICYIQQDLGDESLFSLIQKGKRKEMGAAADGGAPDRSFSLMAEEYVEKSMRELARMQTVAAGEYEEAIEYPEFSRRQILWDLNYFKYEFLKPMALDFNESLLEDDFDAFADALLKVDRSRWGFMYRDFQSRNVMIHDAHPYFIDFQGGMIGPSVYDAVSFLWQAKAGFSAEFRDRMLCIYADTYAEIRSGAVTAEDMLADVPQYALFRTLQVLGAYGFRGLVEKRAHFIESIPAALENLRSLIGGGVADRYTELKRVCESILADGRFEPDGHEGLLIKVFSFSYKKGYPVDLTGNGGGFMFDCRGMHNPGRYEEFKHLTGLDQPVIDFLKERGEIDPFCERAAQLVAPTVECFLRRGFRDLQIGFGCTGGQHRSVYSAEKVGRLLKSRFPDAHIQIIHREQS